MAKKNFVDAEIYASKEYADYERTLGAERSERFLEEQSFINSLFDKRGEMKTLRASTVGSLGLDDYDDIMY